jgi:membrane-associated phospholipid phosphatase
VRSSEVVAFVYFAALTVVAWLRPLPADRRRQITTIGVAMCAVVFTIGHHAPRVVRDWAPGVSIIVGYYLSGRFFVKPSETLEEWLMAWDRRLLGDPTTRFAGWPPSVLAYLEIVYVTCFVLVPAGAAALVLAGHASLLDRYWTMVLAAELGSFGPLSVIQSRPPWLVEQKAALPDRAVHRVASRMVESFTINANTFPSGHVAGSLAVALALLGPLPAVGAVFLFLALSITVACVVGRYHYVVDAIAGATLAIAVWAAIQ